MEKLADQDQVYRARYGQVLDQLKEYRPLLPLIRRYAVNDHELNKVRDLGRTINDLIGPKTIKDRGLEIGALARSAVWSWRLRLLGDRIQPRTIVSQYGQG